MSDSLDVMRKLVDFLNSAREVDPEYVARLMEAWCVTADDLAAHEHVADEVERVNCGRSVLAAINTVAQHFGERRIIMHLTDNVEEDLIGFSLSTSEGGVAEDWEDQI